MKLQELVSHHASALNETDLAVWRYIESHPQECCYISIYDLANRCHVSRTSVLRFAKKLGLDGFSDLKSMLKLDQSRADAVPALNIAEATTNLCQKIGEEIAKQDFQRVNSLMHEAKRVFSIPPALSSAILPASWRASSCRQTSAFSQSMAAMNSALSCAKPRRATSLSSSR